MEPRKENDAMSDDPERDAALAMTKAEFDALAATARPANVVQRTSEARLRWYETQIRVLAKAWDRQAPTTGQVSDRVASERSGTREAHRGEPRLRQPDPRAKRLQPLGGPDGNCTSCGHMFGPHEVIAFDPKEGGVILCQERECDCASTWAPAWEDGSGGVVKTERPVREVVLALLELYGGDAQWDAGKCERLIGRLYP